MAGKTPLVSIIVVNWNGGEILINCLKSLQRLRYPNWELILVDNGSADGSDHYPEKIKLSAKRYELIKNDKNLGFAPANNQGYEKAKGEYLLLLNNDTKVAPDFLMKLVEKMEEDESIGVLQPKIFMMDKPGYLDNAGSFLTRIGFWEHWGFGQKDGKEFNEEREIFSAKGACMLIRRSVVDKVGLFDKDFFSYFEETDFCWRVLLSGRRVIYYPKSQIEHKIGFTIRRLDVSNINYHYYKNRISSLIKNLEAHNLVLILVPHFIVSLGIFFLFLFKLQPRHAFIIIQAILWNLANLHLILRKRKEIQKSRVVSDSELFGKLMHPINWGKYIQDFKRVEKDLRRKNNEK